MFKLTAILLLAGCLQLSAKSYGQRISISRKNASLQQLFLDIYKQSGYYFYCRDELLMNAKKVNIEVKGASLEEVLKICFKDQPLTYTISDHVIVVKPLPEISAPKIQVLIDVKGKVLNEQGDPLEGAAVMVKGTRTGTQTDAGGNFEMKGVENDAVLEISYTGYGTKTISLNSSDFLMAVLSLSVSPLDQVQVIAYGTVTQRLNTGSVSKVTNAEISKQPVSNPLEALEGRMPGVYIQQMTGTSGGGINIQIRGQNSLRTSQNSSVDGNLPLYIVDGVPFSSTSLSSQSISNAIVPFSSPLNTINPADIESIEVLKDADATAIYGSRGANGVVLITTKKGKPGQTRTELNVYTGQGKVTRQMDLLNNQQYLQMRHEAKLNSQSPLYPYDVDINGAWDTTRYTDWQKVLIGGTAHTTSAQASVSGGNKNTQFLFGGGYFRQSTVFPGDFADQKGSAHLNLTHISENKKFKSNITASYLSDNNDLTGFDPTGAALTLSPDAPPVYNPDGSLNWANSFWTNPFSGFYAKYKENSNNLLSNAALSYEIMSHLEVKVNLGYNHMQMIEWANNPKISQDPAYYYASSAVFGNSNLNTWIIEPQIEYACYLGRGKLDILAGSTFQQTTNNGQSLEGVGFPNDALLQNLQSASNIYVVGSNDVQYKYNAFFGRINYNWKDRYLLDLTGRRDGSSRFGPGKQFSNFGAIGAAWIFSKEKIIASHLPFLSFGKIRSSYGITGNDQIGDYGYLDSYSSTAYAYNGTTGLLMTRLANADYSWETNKKFEVALTLGFLKDRILMTADYYSNRSSNQLVGYPLPFITGQSSIQANLPATVENTGWEFELNTINVKNRVLSWSTGFNLTIPRNQLLSYPNISGSPFAYNYVVGQSLQTQYNYQFAGVNPQTGVLQYLDKTGQPVSVPVFPNDYTYLKKTGINFYGGFQNSLTYKGWQLTVLFQFVSQVANNYRTYFGMPGLRSNQPEIVMARWQKPGDRRSSQQFSESYGSMPYTAYQNLQSSTGSVSDASFIRLKNLSLSYELPSQWLDRTKIKSLSVYLLGQNIATITHYLGLDPESQSFLLTPPLRTITGGIKITF